jgi:hypothetical protein
VPALLCCELTWPILCCIRCDAIANQVDAGQEHDRVARQSRVPLRPWTPGIVCSLKWAPIFGPRRKLWFYGSYRPPFHGVALQLVAPQKKVKKGSEKGSVEKGSVLILSTPRPASSGGTRDGSGNRACPSSGAGRSNPPSSSSPPASAPPKPPSLNPPWSEFWDPLPATAPASTPPR